MDEAVAQGFVEQFEGELPFNHARYTEAADRLAGTADVRYVLMRAKALHRLRRPMEAIEALLVLEPTQAVEQARRHLILGMAYTETDQGRLADAHLAVAAEAFAEESMVPAELTYAQALRLWQRGALDEAELLMREQLVERERDPKAHDAALASAHRFLSWVAASRGMLHEQVEHLRTAVAVLKSYCTDPYLAAKIAHPMAVLARELDVPGLARQTSEFVGGIRWSPDLAVEHFQVLRSLSWCDALDGDGIGALRKLHVAEDVAPTPTARLVAQIDRVYLLQHVLDAGSHELLGQVRSAAARIDWNRTGGEDRLALLSAAEAVAEVDPIDASGFVSRYKTLATGSDATLQQARGDIRLDAFEAYTTAVIQRRLGETQIAIALFKAAYEIFDRVGYRWRAALAAIEIGELSADTQWFALAARAIESFPRSWIARRLHRSRSVSAKPWLAELTPAQRTVFEGLVAGKGAGAIARQMGRSPNTIRNHISAVYRVFSVASQAELIAAAARRGAVATT